MRTIDYSRFLMISTLFFLSFCHSTISVSTQNFHSLFVHHVTSGIIQYVPKALQLIHSKKWTRENKTKPTYSTSNFLLFLIKKKKNYLLQMWSESSRLMKYVAQNSPKVAKQWGQDSWAGATRVKLVILTPFPSVWTIRTQKITLELVIAEECLRPSNAKTHFDIDCPGMLS